MAIAKPAGLDEAMKPFKGLIHAWSLSTNLNNPYSGIADSTQLRNALYGPPVTVGDLRTLVRVMESFYGEFPL